jgi:hypothetical protein
MPKKYRDPAIILGLGFIAVVIVIYLARLIY